MVEIDQNTTPLAVGSTVLVADDSAELRALLGSVLTRDGFDVVEAKDGRELLDHLGLGSELTPTRSFDLIISDVRMPHCTGIDVLRTLRELRWPTPVILMTAFGDPELHRAAFQLGAVMTLDKPISLYALRDAVRKLVDPPWW